MRIVVRIGLPDAFISVGIVDALGKQLTSPGEMVRGYAAIAIGYLTFNPIAKRQTLNMCVVMYKHRHIIILSHLNAYFFRHRYILAEALFLP